MNTTLTRAEAIRRRDAAWERYGHAKAERDSWANTLAQNVATGRSQAQGSIDAYTAARAAAFEARADWREALQRCGELMSS
jgi:hypothetical protein